jgi:hypothetical protein
MKLEQIGKTIVAGFGDRALVGFLMGLLDDVPPLRVYELIKNNEPLFAWATEADWAEFRKWAERAQVKDLTRDRIIKELKKYHPELLGLILNTPGGSDWLDVQIARIRQKLGLETAPSS